MLFGSHTFHHSFVVDASKSWPVVFQSELRRFDLAGFYCAQGPPFRRALEERSLKRENVLCLLSHVLWMDCGKPPSRSRAGLGKRLERVHRLCRIMFARRREHEKVQVCIAFPIQNRSKIVSTRKDVDVIIIPLVYVELAGFSATSLEDLDRIGHFDT